MIVSVSLSDETFAQYAERNKQNPAKALAAQLEAFKDVNPLVDRAIVVHGKDRQALEKAAQSTFDSPESLVKWAEKLKTLEIGEQKFPLSDAQLKRAHSNANFYKQDVNAFIAQKVKRALEVEFGF